MRVYLIVLAGNYEGIRKNEALNFTMNPTKLETIRIDDETVLNRETSVLQMSSYKGSCKSKFSEFIAGDGTPISNMTFEDVKIEGIRFEILVSFFNARLTSISLSAKTDLDGKEWDIKRDERQNERKQIHNKWLGIGPTEYKVETTWGVISSANDPRETTDAYIEIKYK